MIIHECEQGTDEWFRLRAGKPTSSNFKKLITSAGKKSATLNDYAFELEAEIEKSGPVSDFAGNKHTERGHRLEPIARKSYEFISSSEVQEVGFITDDLMRYGSSTDGLVGGQGVLEIKCLIPKEHGKALYYYNTKGKMPPAYVAQVQGELLVTERDWCDLFFYTEDGGKPFIIRATPDAHIIDALIEHINAVILKRDEIYKVNKGKL